MAKINGKISHLSTVRKTLKGIKKEDVERINIGYAMIRGYRKDVTIYTKTEEIQFDLTSREFGYIAYRLDELNGEKLQYLK